MLITIINKIMIDLKKFKMCKNQMSSIMGGLLCKVKYPDGSSNYKVVVTTQSPEVTAAELTAQGMGAYVVIC